jgi:hypothetical protein
MDRSKTQGETEFRNSGNQRRSGAALLPIMAAVFIAFIVIGLAIPVLPLHVHQGLGLGTFLVGLVAVVIRGADPESSFYAHGSWTYRRDAPVEARLVVLIVSTSLMIGVFAVLYIGFFCVRCKIRSVAQKIRVSNFMQTRLGHRPRLIPRVGFSYEREIIMCIFRSRGKGTGVC